MYDLHHGLLGVIYMTPTGEWNPRHPRRPERVGQWWRLAKGSRDTLIPDAATRQRSAGQRARTRLRPQRSDLDQVAFLARIPLSRLQALIAGAPVTIEERQALMRVLPDWKPRD